MAGSPTECFWIFVCFFIPALECVKTSLLVFVKFQMCLYCKYKECISSAMKNMYLKEESLSTFNLFIDKVHFYFVY